jgi:hypothetical protein
MIASNDAPQRSRRVPPRLCRPRKLELPPPWNRRKPQLEWRTVLQGDGPRQAPAPTIPNLSTLPKGCPIAGQRPALQRLYTQGPKSFIRGCRRPDSLRPPFASPWGRWFDVVAKRRRQIFLFRICIYRSSPRFQICEPVRRNGCPTGVGIPSPQRRAWRPGWDKAITAPYEDGRGSMNRRARVA